ncbi:DNA polymerase III subunit [Deferribacter autotrophicus]|uniref:DNA polymerase III subunit n=1 Tax=Deferribacter autotrophicus TaxID=500465 RepID=A0A5A8F0T4_9BACT|nr:DNA polymerase III subunit [Deferribacter autotrophicus]KAA0257678.1 DNA polymerase III subunit [Deferribacter autotrophicus]
MLLGHNHLKEYFKVVARNNTFHSSYIFYGNEGVGKKLFAIYLAKGVHCENGVFFEDCSCSSCRQIDNKSHPDVVILEEDELKIDNIRELNEKAFLSSFSGKRKFFILDNFHKIKREAANAMLKTLEESPQDTTFILVTHNYEMIIPTIRSRSIKIMFHRLSPNEMEQLHSFVKEEEEIYDVDLENFDLLEFVNFISKVKERDELKVILKRFYKDFRALYLKSMNEKYLDYSDYLLDILKSVDYNINLDIAKGYLITKMIEVASD